MFAYPLHYTEVWAMCTNPVGLKKRAKMVPNTLSIHIPLVHLQLLLPTRYSSKVALRLHDQVIHQFFRPVTLVPFGRLKIGN